MIDHRRDDLDYLPSDCEPPAHECGCSAYLCEVCNPRRDYLTAALQVSLARAKPEPEPKGNNIVVLASWRQM